MRKAILNFLVIEAIALSLLALLIHIVWDDEPMRSNFTVLVWPLTSVIALLIASMLAKPGMPVILLGAPLMLWLALLILSHFSNLVMGDPSLFYASDSWASLIPILVIVAIAGIFALRNRGLGGRST